MDLYRELLKSPDEIAQDKAKEEELKINQAVEYAERVHWQGLPSSKKFLHQLVKIFESKRDSYLTASSNTDITNEQFRLNAVEVQTLNKVLNLLYHGTYADTGVNDSSANNK